MGSNGGWLVDAVSRYGAVATPKLQRAAELSGQPEDQLRAPLEGLLVTAGDHLGVDVTLVGEVTQAGSRSRPDYGVVVNGAVVGLIEVKAPGKGADPHAFHRGHDRDQWQKYGGLPNLLYTDGNEFGLYRDGKRASRIARLDGDVRRDGASLRPGEHLSAILTSFVGWEPTPPRSAPELAKLLAGLCRTLRDEVIAVLADERRVGGGPFTSLASDWRDLLFPDADDERFADSYAQTVTFALLLARIEGGDVLDVEMAAKALRVRHGLLAKALQVLTEEGAAEAVALPLKVLQRVVAAVAWAAVQHAGADHGTGDPWTSFYEDFLAAYDHKYRQEQGAYYTPPAVVHAQVRLVESVLTDRLGLRLSFADDQVVTLDPAMGSGAYLTAVIDAAAERVRTAEGPGSVGARISGLVKRLIGFEVMVGPFAVAETQVTAAVERAEGGVGPDGTRLYLADTLDDPYEEVVRLGGTYGPIAQSRREANAVKAEEDVYVCLGNPPYDRHAADLGRGKWVVEGSVSVSEGGRRIWDDVTRGVPGKDLVSTRNMYGYFWRWALWKVFETEPRDAGGVVAFITASSFLAGPGWAGMRAHMRTVCDEVWVLDLGGDTRGTRPDSRIFTKVARPVAITVCVRLPNGAHDRPAVVRYRRITGVTTKEKLANLGGVVELVDGDGWRAVPEWQSAFMPPPDPLWTAVPAVSDLIPWSSPGVKVQRTWPIAPEPDLLRRRWDGLAAAPPGPARRAAMKVTRDRSPDRVTAPLPRRLSPVPGSLDGADIGPCPELVRFAYRSFDRQWLLADKRLIDLARDDLWRAHSDRQVYLTTLVTDPIGRGPAVTVAADIPDNHHFRGSFGGVVLPLWRSAEATDPNISRGLLDALGYVHGRPVTPERLFAYVVGLLAHPAYTDRFWDELGDGGPHVPLSADGALFDEVADVGAEVAWVHTFGQRYTTLPERRPREALTGSARVLVAIPGDPARHPDRLIYDADARTLAVGDGRVGPVAPEVWGYHVSAMHVIGKWFGYRQRGRRIVQPRDDASPLDAIVLDGWTPSLTTDLLGLLAALERLVALEPRQATLLDGVLDGPVVDVSTLTSADVLPVLAAERRRDPVRYVPR